MYDCPNCGGNLRFDIPLQQLHCDYCGTNLDPYSYEKKKDAVESQVFETTVYTCPQCGGEIMTTNVSATGFCLYCGASTILDSRIRNEKRPARIIPFRKTKEDCKKSFAAMMKRSLYAPKELKSPDYLEKFRGIYMPYWMFDFRIDGVSGLPGKTTSRKGDYIITKHYSLSCGMDTVYNGVSFDASSSLDDSLSESIAPFDPDEAKEFTPSFLCGFYADTADVPADTYSGEAFSMIADDLIDRAASQIFPDKSADSPDDPQKYLHYSSSEPACAMFPVWFLTYRHKNRVAYAVMNGQTGKISSDLPIVEWKYLAGSLICSVPLFFLFNAVLTVTAPTALLLTMVPAAAAGFAYLSEIRTQISVESHEGDKGYQAAIRIAPGAVSPGGDLAGGNMPGAEPADPAARRTDPAGENMQAADSADPAARRTDPADENMQAADPADPAARRTDPADENMQAEDPVETDMSGADPEEELIRESEFEDEPLDTEQEDSEGRRGGSGKKKKDKKGKEEKKEKKEKRKKSSYTFLILIVCYAAATVAGAVESRSSVTNILQFVLSIAPVLLGILLAILGANLQKEHGAAKAAVFPGLAGAILALAVTEIVTILHPVADLYYYGAGVASILCTGFTLIAVIRRYNIMATRPLPSFFDRKGGDVRG